MSDVINGVLRDEFQREERYVVVKISKMHPHPEFRRRHLEALKAENIAALVDCVVVEKDWPEYETVWKMIEARVSGATAQPAADDAQRFCNKCGYCGPLEHHHRPGSEALCGYLSCAAKPAADGEREVWAVPVLDGEKKTTFYTEQLPFVPGIGVKQLGEPVRMVEARAAQPQQAVAVAVAEGWRVDRANYPNGYVLYSPGGGMTRICDSGGGGVETAFAMFLKALLAAAPVPPVSQATFTIGDHVRKTKGSRWQGVIVGTYSTALTPEGYAVESDTETGSVQIYPVSALERVRGDRGSPSGGA